MSKTNYFNFTFNVVLGVKVLLFSLASYKVIFDLMNYLHTIRL